MHLPPTHITPKGTNDCNTRQYFLQLSTAVFSIKSVSSPLLHGVWPEKPMVCGIWNSAMPNLINCKLMLTSISGPPTQRTAGSWRCNNRWLASSSKPHWQIARVAPASFTLKHTRPIMNKMWGIKKCCMYKCQCSTHADEGKYFFLNVSACRNNTDTWDK